MIGAFFLKKMADYGLLKYYQKGTPLLVSKKGNAN
jgi:hypothetical protein